MIVVFYRTTIDGAVESGRITYEAGNLKIENAEIEADLLLRDVKDRANQVVMFDALQKAPVLFDGAYYRAEIKDAPPAT